MTNAETHKAFIVAFLLRAILEQNRKYGKRENMWKICLLQEDFLRQQRGDNEVRDVDHVADPKVNGDAADAVRLLARKSAFPEKLDHLKECIARGKIQILRVIGAVLFDRHAHGSDEVPRCRPFGLVEVSRMREARRLNVFPSRFTVVNAELHGYRRSHLYGSNADLAVALGEVSVPG